VSTMDIAGNESEVVELCDPCHLRDDRDAPEPYTSAPEEPAWSEADILPDGVCAPTEPPSDESSTSDTTEGSESGSEPDATTTSSTTDLTTGDTSSPSDSGVVDRGCACRSAPPSVFPLLALLAIRRRRASRRAPW
jgi:MYXO-CTERM domain-containing protein